MYQECMHAYVNTYMNACVKACARSAARLMEAFHRLISTQMHACNRRACAHTDRQVVVLQLDIMGFTKLGSEMKPDDLAQNINALFSRFDRALTRCARRQAWQTLDPKPETIKPLQRRRDRRLRLEWSIVQ